MSTDRDTTVRITNLSKMFKVYAQSRDMLWEMITRRPRHTEFWALREISLEVRRGETVGLIGRNGAGKSTLLKILTGTLDKTSGGLVINGRVSAILELGSGFHPEYSGRENVYMGGMCLGMSRKEIDEKIDSIVEFAELERVIDQPFKTYSSGMQARLTFSTAVSVDPDILIVDEALSVGDAKFQLKCYDKMAAFRRSGKTILLVSHDLNSVATFCDRTFLLERGRVLAEGDPKDVTRKYHKMLFGESSRLDAQEGATTEEGQPTRRRSNSQGETERIKLLAAEKLSAPASETHVDAIRYGSNKAQIIDFGILDGRGEKVTILEAGQQYSFVFSCLFHERVDDACVGFLIRNSKGLDLFGTNNQLQQVWITPQQPGQILEARLNVTMWLGGGDYFLTFALVQSDGTPYDFRWDALRFSVLADPSTFTTSIVNLAPQMLIRPVGRAALEESIPPN